MATHQAAMGGAGADRTVLQRLYLAARRPLLALENADYQLLLRGGTGRKRTDRQAADASGGQRHILLHPPRLAAVYLGLVGIFSALGRIALLVRPICLQCGFGKLEKPVHSLQKLRTTGIHGSIFGNTRHRIAAIPENRNRLPSNKPFQPNRTTALKIHRIKAT